MEAVKENVNRMLEELYELLLVTKDKEELKRLRDLRRGYFKTLETITRHEIDEATLEFREIIESLDSAGQAAHQAKKDVEKVAHAIERAAAVLNVLERALSL